MAASLFPPFGRLRAAALRARELACARGRAILNHRILLPTLQHVLTAHDRCFAAGRAPKGQKGLVELRRATWRRMRKTSEPVRDQDCENPIRSPSKSNMRLRASDAARSSAGGAQEEVLAIGVEHPRERVSLSARRRAARAGVPAKTVWSKGPWSRVRRQNTMSSASAQRVASAGARQRGPHSRWQLPEAAGPPAGRRGGVRATAIPSSVGILRYRSTCGVVYSISYLACRAVSDTLPHYEG